MKFFTIFLYLIITILLYLIIYTPEYISNLTWTIYIKRSYTINGKPGFYTFLYNHSQADGMLTEHIFKHCALPKQSKKPVQSCTMWTPIALHAHLPYPSHATSFQRLCAFIVNFYMQQRKCDEVSVGIVVGMRSFLEEYKRWIPGCFIRYARYHVSKEHNLSQICDLQDNAIQNIHKDGKLNQSIIEKTDHLADLKFNKWMLDTIHRNDGTTMHLHRGGKQVDLQTILFNKRKIHDFKCIKKGRDEWILMV